MYAIKIRKIKFRQIIMVNIFLMCLFQMALVDYTHGILNRVVSYTDEILTAIFLLVCIFNLNKLLKDKNDRKILTYSIILLLIGTISSMYYQYQSIVPSFIDAIFTTMKFIITYFGVKILYKRRVSEKFIFINFNFITKICTGILFLLALHDFIFQPFFQKGDYRYFTESIKLFYSHETYLAFSGIILLIIHCINLKWDKSNLLYMYMISLVILLTLRSKAIGFIIIFWGLYFWIFIIKKKRVLYLLILSIISIGFAMKEQIVNYFFTQGYSPRLIMLSDSIMLALDNFPIGTGFATFGGVMSVKYYSPVYRALGYTSYHGMNEVNSNFLYDGFWPGVISQFGFIGTIAFMGIILSFLKIALLNFKIDKQNGFGLIMILTYLFISSTSETSFFNPMSLLMFGLFGLIVLQNKLT